ncbi:hypothetical protein V8C37DRAFT_382930 [Trichoderma ceciliae]
MRGFAYGQGTRKFYTLTCDRRKGFILSSLHRIFCIAAGVIYPTKSSYISIRAFCYSRQTNKSPQVWISPSLAMDHLPLPTDDFARSPFEVPFLCNDQFRYDDHGFMTFPLRAGLDIDQIIERGLVDPDTLAPALQAWLWFGLLGDILGIGSRTHVAQRIANYKTFVTEKPCGTSVITTSTLLRCIDQVGRKNKSLRPDGVYGERYYASLQVAACSIKRLLSSDMCRKHLRSDRQFCQLPVLFRVILSTQILTESLRVAELVLLPGKGDLLLRPTIDCSSYELVDKLLIDAGWCKYEVGRLPGSIRLRYYLSFLHPSDSAQANGNHLSCTGDACVHIPKSINEHNIKPKHVTKDCMCSIETLQDCSVMQIVEAGAVPLLRFPQIDGAARKLELLDATIGKDLSPFVAISHVRHAGLGNGDAHSLPYCQLACIQEFVNQIYHPSSNLSHSHTSHATCSTPFWLDTMCIPSERRAHAASLKHIRRIFQHASRILVIDQALCSHAIGSPEDALIRIRYSLWRRRLWTLQEGFVTSASNLMFCFSNNIVSLRSLLDSYKASVPFPLLSCRQFVGFPVLSYLNETLEMLDDDIKMLTRMPQALVGHLEKTKLRRILRLGYLASDVYKYFREDLEIEQIQKILPLLGGLYMDSTGLPIQAGSRSEDQIVSGLEKLYEIAM